MQKSVKDLKLNTIIADKLLLKLDLKQSTLFHHVTRFLDLFSSLLLYVFKKINALGYKI